MVQKFANELQAEIGKIFIGKQDTVRLITASIFCGGHVLLDDLPGTGKTTLIRTISRALGCEFKRVQFTPAKRKKKTCFILRNRSNRPSMRRGNRVSRSAVAPDGICKALRRNSKINKKNLQKRKILTILTKRGKIRNMLRKWYKI